MNVTLLRMLREKTALGYRLFRPSGVLTASELCMCAGIVNRRPRFGVINVYRNAYLVLDDGSLASGIFSQPDNGHCSLS